MEYFIAFGSLVVLVIGAVFYGRISHKKDVTEKQLDNTQKELERHAKMYEDRPVSARDAVRRMRGEDE